MTISGFTGCNCGNLRQALSINCVRDVIHATDRVSPWFAWDTIKRQLTSVRSKLRRASALSFLVWSQTVMAWAVYARYLWHFCRTCSPHLRKGKSLHPAVYQRLQLLGCNPTTFITNDLFITAQPIEILFDAEQEMVPHRFNVYFWPLTILLFSMFLVFRSVKDAITVYQNK